MAERSMYFNDTDYLADDWAKQIALLLTDGVYTKDGKMGLAVTPSTGLKVNIAAGYAVIKGYIYENDSNLVKTFDPADTVLNRIDRLVLKLDITNQEIKMQVKKGTFASNPVPPNLIEGEMVKEIPIAQIRINKGATTITANDIKDERIPLSSLIEIPIEEMWDIWNGELADIQQIWDNWYQNATTGVIKANMIEQNATHRFITDALLDKLAGIEEGAQKNVTPSKNDIGLDKVDNLKQMPIAGGTFTGIAKSQANTSYSTAQLRNVTLSTGNPTGGANGDIWIKYK